MYLTNRMSQCLLAQEAEVHNARSCGAERSWTLSSKQRCILRSVGREGRQARSQALCFLLVKGPRCQRMPDVPCSGGGACSAELLHRRHAAKQGRTDWRTVACISVVGCVR